MLTKIKQFIKQRTVKVPRIWDILGEEIIFVDFDKKIMKNYHAKNGNSNQHIAHECPRFHQDIENTILELNKLREINDKKHEEIQNRILNNESPDPEFLREMNKETLKLMKEEEEAKEDANRYLIAKYKKDLTAFSCGLLD